MGRAAAAEFAVVLLVHPSAYARRDVERESEGQAVGWHQAHHDGGLTCRAGKLHEKRRARGVLMGDGDGVRRHRAPRAPTAHN